MARQRVLTRAWAVPVALAIVAIGAGAVLAAPTAWLAVDGGIRFNTLGGSTYDWANSGGGAPTYVCQAGAVNLSGPGGLFNCGRPGVGSNPPIGPTRTPAAAADPSIISAAFVVDPISIDSTSCGAGDSTVVGGGAKNGDALSSITTTSGSVPDKDDLGNVYAVSHTRADTGHPEIFFAAERLVNNGDSHIDFEFMQSQVGVTAPCSGAFTGHRSEGDLLVAIDFTGGGVTAGTSVYQWHCAAEPGPQPPDGTICDPTGVQHYQLIPAPTFLTFLVNAANTSCGGWVCRDKLSASTAVVSARDFLEGGIDLAGIPFAGCFNTFLPHTRTAQSFTSGLKDFAGPMSIHSCRDPVMSSTSTPRTGSVVAGTPATDSVNVGNGGAGPVPTGTVTFFLCSPAQTTAGGCTTGGGQVGAAKALVSGMATSDPTAATTATGTYCWRAEYAPDAASTGIYTAGTHTNLGTECFGVAPVVGLPNTAAPVGLPDSPAPAGILAIPLLLLAAARLRARAAALVLAAALFVGLAPDSMQPPIQPAPGIVTSSATDHLVASDHLGSAAFTPAATAVLPAKNSDAWRLVIPKIGVDAIIQPVGLDSRHAMAVPATLDKVGWFDSGPQPGQRGDAVIAGHLGFPAYPAVFRNLIHLSAGDTFDVVWPGGRTVHFRVTTARLVPADASPPDVFSRAGPARLSLITCAGAWEQAAATDSERLIVTAVPV